MIALGRPGFPSTEFAHVAARIWYIFYLYGGMAERLKAAVLKTAEAQASVGSNPTPSAMGYSRIGGKPERWPSKAEGNRLLSGCTPNSVPRVRIPPSPPFSLTQGAADSSFLYCTGGLTATAGLVAKARQIRAQYGMLLSVEMWRGVRAGRRNATGNRVGA